MTKRLFIAMATLVVAAGCDSSSAPEVPASIALPADVATLDAVGRTVSLPAVAKTAAGKELTIPLLTWTSASATVATVDAQGLVTARGEGDAAITATYAPGVAGSATMHVRATVTFTAQRLAMQNAVVDSAKSVGTAAVVVHAK